MQVYNIYGLIKAIPSGYCRPNLPPTFRSKFWIRIPPIYQYGTEDAIQVFNTEANEDASVAYNDLYSCDVASDNIDETTLLSNSLSSFSVSDNVSNLRNSKVVLNINEASSSSSEILDEKNHVDELVEHRIQKSSSTSSIECPYSTFNLVKSDPMTNQQHEKYDECETEILISRVHIDRGKYLNDENTYEDFLGENRKERDDFDKIYLDMFQRPESLIEERYNELDDVDEHQSSDQEEEYLEYYDESLDEYYMDLNENSYEMDELQYDYETRLLQLEREQRESNTQMQQKIDYYQRLTKQNRVIFYEPVDNSDEELKRYEANLPCLSDIEPSNLANGITKTHNNHRNDSNSSKSSKNRRGMGSMLKNIKQSSIVNLSIIAEESSSFEASSNSNSDLVKNKKPKENMEVKYSQKNLKTTVNNTKNNSFHNLVRSLSHSSSLTPSSSEESCGELRDFPISELQNEKIKSISKFNPEYHKLDLVYV